jgi:MFS family permease
VVEHVLHPSLDPTTHEVSEYVHASAGWVITLGFLAWAVSLAATGWGVAVVWRSRLLSTCLWLAAAGLVLLSACPTETSAGKLPPGQSLTITGRIHDVGSGLTTLALLAAAPLSTAVDRDASPRFRRRALLLIAIAVIGSAALLAAGPAVGGLRQRLAILCGCIWQLLLLGALARSDPRPGAPPPTEPPGSASC